VLPLRFFMAGRNVPLRIYLKYISILFSVAYSPNRAWPRRSRFLDHAQLLDTHTHTRTQAHAADFCEEGSVCRKDHYIHNKKQTQETNIHAPSGNRSRDPSNQAVSDLRIKTFDHWDRLCVKKTNFKIYSYF
jgi:hypothetical protein